MISIEQVKESLIHLSVIIKQRKTELEAVDKKSGDGDLGISMDKGADAVISQVQNDSGTDIGALFLQCAMAVNKAAPSTMGTLLSSSLMRLGQKYKGRHELEEREVMEIPSLIAEAIRKRGKAKPGDRTILDALIPAADTMWKAAEKGESAGQALAQTIHEAKKGLESTKSMVPKIGRAKWAPENSEGVPDGGALLCVIILESFM